MAWTNAYSLEQLGSFIQSTRRERGYTQQEFAHIIGVSHATLSALENGVAVSSRHVERALQFLGLRIAVVPKAAHVTVDEARDRSHGAHHG